MKVEFTDTTIRFIPESNEDDKKLDKFVRDYESSNGYIELHSEGERDEILIIRY